MSYRPANPSWMRWFGASFVALGVAALVLTALISDDARWFNWAVGAALLMQGCTFLLTWRKNMRTYREWQNE